MQPICYNDNYKGGDLMFNKQEYEMFLISKNLKNKNIQSVLGISKQALSNKILGKSAFSINDIDALIDNYNLSNQELVSIFFTKRIDK